MARRTKSDALATRDTILDCAETLFIRQGVAHTTLQHIALQAGVTRGAIYWHFPDKAAVFNAMMQRAKMPLESAMQSMRLADPADPLTDLHECAIMVFELTEHDPQARRVFEIVTLKIEFVDEMDAVGARRAEVQASWMACAENKIRIAIRSGQARADIQAHVGALALWSLIDGLLRAWMIAPASFALRERTRRRTVLSLSKCYTSFKPHEARYEVCLWTIWIGQLAAV
jgi:TetR/AcrR family acrAB operon transcriptional repressor